MEYFYNKHYVKNITENIIKPANLLLMGGNGGSFEQCAHMSAELIGSFEGNTTEVFPAMAMGTNTSELTAIANDFGYEQLYIRYIKAFINIKPVFLFISTSGTSKNVITAIEYLLKINYYMDGSKIILLTGKKNIYNNVIHEINCDYNTTAEIQECHLNVLHYMARIIKNI